jgi:cytochrome P450 / NADPH-cytochrome P450 reductase
MPLSDAIIQLGLGFLSFIIYELLKNPSAMAKLRAQVDELIGSRPIQYEDLEKLTYLTGKRRPYK